MALVGLKAEPIALSTETVDKLLQRGNGDAALLYLYLLRRGGNYDRGTAQKDLNWNVAQVMSAFAHLVELGLAEDNTPKERRDLPEAQNCPEYSREDIDAQIRTDKGFSGLLDEVELLLGKKLSVMELKILLELYDHLAMLPEVLILLTARKIEETEEKYGPGRRPRLSEIKAEAYKWKKNGIDTLQNADEYLRRMDYFRSQEGELLRAVGVSGRKAVEGERRFLHRWADWGFTADAVSLAYERTVMRKQAMDWSYCNAILRNWNEKNCHTRAEIEHAEQRRSRHKVATPPEKSPAAGEQARKNLEWMRRMAEEE